MFSVLFLSLINIFKESMYKNRPIILHFYFTDIFYPFLLIFILFLHLEHLKVFDTTPTIIKYTIALFLALHIFIMTKFSSFYGQK